MGTNWEGFSVGHISVPRRNECAYEVTDKNKGPVKLMQRVKIAHSFLQSVSNQFHVIRLSLPM